MTFFQNQPAVNEGLPALEGKGGAVGGDPRHEPLQPLGQVGGRLGDIAAARVLVDEVEQHPAILLQGEEQPADALGEVGVHRPSAAEPGRQVGQRHPAQEVQVDAGALGAQGGLELLLADLHGGGGAGEGVGQGICKLQEKAVQGGVVVLDAGAALGREDHHADGAGQGALAPVPQHLAGRDRLFAGKDRLQPGHQVPAAGGAVHIELGAAQQIHRRQGQKHDEHVLPPLDEGALFLISHGQVPRWAARCGWWCRDPAGPPGR